MSKFCLHHPKRRAIARGLCAKCHQHLTRAGLLASVALIEEGKILAPKPRGRKRRVRPFPPKN